VACWKDNTFTPWNPVNDHVQKRAYHGAHNKKQ